MQSWALILRIQKHKISFPYLTFVYTALSTTADIGYNIVEVEGSTWRLGKRR